MNTQELARCMKRIEAYYPGEWDEARRSVWAEPLLSMTLADAERAIVAMGKAEDYPTVSKLLRYAGSGPSERGVIREDGATFMPGVGWLGGRRPGEQDVPALEAPLSPEENLAAVDGARAAMARARRSTARARDRDPAELSEIRRQVDEAAAALREPAPEGLAGKIADAPPAAVSIAAAGLAMPQPMRAAVSAELERLRGEER